MQNSESKRVLDLLEEVEILQTQIGEGLEKSNEQASLEIAKYDRLQEDVAKYVDTLHLISQNMIEICERLNVLNDRIGPRPLHLVSFCGKFSESSGRYVMLLAIVLAILHVIDALICLQCDGRNFSHGLKISVDECCHVSLAVCSEGQVCLRAFVSSPHKKFFLSGCHKPEDRLIGCDTHNLPMNATVHRCACKDSKCQMHFPGTCTSSRKTSSHVKHYHRDHYHLTNNSSSHNSKHSQKHYHNRHSIATSTVSSFLIRELSPSSSTSNVNPSLPDKSSLEISGKHPEMLSHSTANHSSSCKYFIVFIIVCFAYY
ncbi:unnamed protein product [Auanema sp. JU1783]|nr:unnamed protein product [Auanema sp. JU1783]